MILFQVYKSREIIYRLSKPNRFCSFRERLVVFTPDLLRKSTPEGLVENIFVRI